MGGRRTAIFMGGLFALTTASGSPSGSVRSAPRAPLTGTVSFTGQMTPGSAVDLSTDPYCADARDTPMSDSAVRTSGSGGLRDVIVIIRDAPAHAGPDTAPDQVLDQVDCEYVPRVIGIQPGQTLVVRNSDRTLHNVHVTAQNNRGFNIGQPLPGVEARRTFDAPEDAVDVKCDIHGWMQGKIFVLDHPYFAVTDAEGRFTIPDIPPGSYTLEAWHGSLGTRTQTVTVGADGAIISIVFDDS